MSDSTTLHDSGVTARTVSVAPIQSGPDLGVGRADPRRATLDRWSAALARGDDAEVDRLVRQSRMDRAWVAASGQIGAMVDQARPAASNEGTERALFRKPDLLANVTRQTGQERRSMGREYG